MIVLKLLSNILLFVIGVLIFNDGRMGLANRVYPKWIEICGIVLGIAFCIASFTIWLD